MTTKTCKNHIMKHIYLIITLTLIIVSGIHAQVAINETGASPDASAILDISSADKGLLIPRVTTTQRNGINSPQGGLLIYDTDNESFWYYDNTQSGWVELIVDGAMGLDGLSDGKSDNTSVFVGYQAGNFDNGSNYNSSLGVYSLKSNTSGAHNTTIGSYGMYNNTTGSRNTAIGRRANYYNQEGNNNTIIGYWAGMGSTTHNKSGNIFVGYMAGYNETGDNKLYIQNSSSSTPLIGGDFSTNEIYFNGQIKITGGSPGVGKVLTSDADGIASWEAISAASEINGLSDGITDVSNLFLGSFTGTQDDGDNRNTGVGINSLNWNVGGLHNTALGYKSSFRNTSGSSNTSVGNNALYFNTVKSDLVAVGDSALFNNGNNASSSNQEGNNNTAVGSKSLLYNGDGYGNTALGSHSMYENGSGFLNVALGYNSLENITDGDHNLSAGAYSSGVNTTGSENVSLGYGTDYFNDGGSQNVIIGTHAGRGSSGNNKSGNIFIGYKAGYNETGSNKLYIDNSDNSSPLIGGDFNTDELYFNTTQLGIGTENPNEHLEVASPTNSYGRMIISDGGDASRNALLFVSPKASDQNARIEAYDYGSSTGLTLKFNTAGNGNSVFGGDVGIGTTSPLKHLHVMGSSTLASILLSPNESTGGGDSEILFADDNDFTNGIRLKYDGGNNFISFDGRTGGLYNYSILTINRSGSVGVGTSSPLGAFHVHSSDQNNTVYITPTASQSGDSASVLLAEDDGARYGMYWMYDGFGNEMELWGKSGTLRYGPHMLINRNTGNVAIGGENFATGYKLSVEGKVICEEVKVSMQVDWPDYVFNENYKLMPLRGLKKFINDNKHLPNIPTADDVRSSGVELGEMQRLLLEKVEELSLYIIQQDERITDLEEKLSKTK